MKQSVHFEIRRGPLGNFAENERRRLLNAHKTVRLGVVLLVSKVGVALIVRRSDMNIVMGINMEAPISAHCKTRGEVINTNEGDILPVAGVKHRSTNWNKDTCDDTRPAFQREPQCPDCYQTGYPQNCSQILDNLFS
jgi:hypothetical protein